MRSPTRSASSALELPAGAVIDLRFSGTGLEGNEFAALAPNDTSPVVIMFSPNGNVDRIIRHGSIFAPEGAAHFLVGRSDGMVDAENSAAVPNTIPRRGSALTVTYDANIADATSLWVSIGIRTGTTSTTENVWTLMLDPQGGNVVTFEASLHEARLYARRGQAMGGS